MWKKDGGPPPPLKDLGIMLLGGVFPQRYDWLPGLFLYFLIGMGAWVRPCHRALCVFCWGVVVWSGHCVCGLCGPA